MTLTELKTELAGIAGWKKHPTADLWSEECDPTAFTHFDNIPNFASDLEATQSLAKFLTDAELVFVDFFLQHTIEHAWLVHAKLLGQCIVTARRVSIDYRKETGEDIDIDKFLAAQAAESAQND